LRGNCLRQISRIRNRRSNDGRDSSRPSFFLSYLFCVNGAAESPAASLAFDIYYLLAGALGGTAYGRAKHQGIPNLLMDCGEFFALQGLCHGMIRLRAVNDEI